MPARTEHCLRCGIDKLFVLPDRLSSITPHSKQCRVKYLAKTNANTSLRTSTMERKDGLRRKSRFLAIAESLNLVSGDIIGNNYLVVEKIGQGGMGIVYRVVHNAMGRHYALKLLPSDQVNEESLKRFQAEARNLGALNHPTFVRVYDLGIDRNQFPFYTMDLLAGQTLEELIIEHPLPSERAVRIFLEVLDGLAYAHRNGIIHRDIKPSNIMLCADNSIKILDFGLAKATNNSRQNAMVQNLTSEGDVFGSPCYMSPEQSLGAAVDARSDIYSIGCSLFEALTGFVPFEGASSVETILLQQSTPAPSLASVAPQLKFSESLEFVVAKCLEKYPRDRYQSAKELAIDLQRILEGKELSNYLSLGRTSKDKGQEPVMPNSDKVSLVMAILLPLLILSAAASYFFQHSPSAREAASLQKAANKPSPPMPLGTTERAPLLDMPETKIIGPEAVGPEELMALKHCYRPEIKAIRAGFGTFKFPPGLILGTVFWEQNIGAESHSCNLSSLCELPLDRELVLMPSAQLLERPDLVDYLKPLRIRGLVIVPSSIVSSLFNGADKDVLPFYKHMAATRQVHWLSMEYSDSESVRILQFFPELDTLVIGSRCESLASLGDYLKERVHSLRLKEVGRQTELLKAMARSGKLDELHLGGLSLSAEASKVLSEYNHLQVITVSICQVPQPALLTLFKMSLQVLALNYEPWSPEVLTAAEHCRSLRLLALHDIGYIPTAIRKRLSAFPPELKIVSSTEALYPVYRNASQSSPD